MTVAPSKTLRPGPATATGGTGSRVTVIVTSSVAKFPERSVAVRVTMYPPTVTNGYKTTSPYRVCGPPSTNVHTNDAIPTSSADPQSASWTGMPAITTGSGPALAIGGTVSGTTVAMTVSVPRFPAPSTTVSVITNVPALSKLYHSVAPSKVRGTTSVNVHVAETISTLSVDAYMSNTASVPSVTVWSGPASATGAVISRTVSIAVSVAVFPAASRTIRDTSYVPGSGYVSVVVHPHP